MSTLGYTPTTVTTDLSGFNVSYLTNTDNIWKPKVISSVKSKSFNLSLGATLFGSFITLFTISFLILFLSLFVSIPFISTKFAIFLVLFFGGFSGELLYARKLKND